jgi:lipooligosaccharide transport system permease protein
VPMVVAMFFGLDPSWGMLAVPPIAMIAGFGWASFGIYISSLMDSFENFSYIISAVLTPLFLVAGTFFPLDELPEWAQVLAWFNPLYHLVELVRDAVFGWEGLVDLAHLGVLVAFGLIMWRLAVRGTARKLII